VLSGATIQDNVLYLESAQLERTLYQKVNKVLELMGGKWNRKTRGHVFDGDPTDKLEAVLLTGEIIDAKKEFGYFPTPPGLAAHLVEMAEIEPGMEVLEPSAGEGNIAELLAQTGCYLSVIELLPENRQALINKGYNLIGDDFLKFSGRTFDRIVMNPPFSSQQDIDHVLHAFDLLDPGGRVVAIMAVGFTFRQDKKASSFRSYAENTGWWEMNDEGAFQSSGTMVRTVTVCLDKFRGRGNR